MSPRKIKQETTVLVETVETSEDKDEKEYTVSFKMTARDHENLERFAQDQGRSKSFIIREAVNKFVAQVDGVIEAKVPLADFKSLMLLIEKDQALGIEACVSEAIRDFNLKKGKELAEIKNLRASLISD